MKQSVWNCPACGTRVQVSGRLGSEIAIGCPACGKRHDFSSFDKLVEYEERLQLQPVAATTRRDEQLARNVMLSLQRH